MATKITNQDSGLSTTIYSNTTLSSAPQAVTPGTSTVVYGLKITNATGSDGWVKIYHLATTVTAGTTAPDITIPVANGWSDDPIFITTGGVTLANGLQVRISDAGGGTAGTGSLSVDTSVVLAT